MADKIDPGSSGYYRFRLENSRSKALDVTLTLTEGDIHLPLEIVLTPLDSDGKKIDVQAVPGSIVNGALTLHARIEANGSAVYQLDWKWPFDGSDAVDTAAGQSGGAYTLQIQIYAEEK